MRESGMHFPEFLKFRTHQSGSSDDGPRENIAWWARLVSTVDFVQVESRGLELFHDAIQAGIGILGGGCHHSQIVTIRKAGGTMLQRGRRPIRDDAAVRVKA